MGNTDIDVIYSFIFRGQKEKESDESTKGDVGLPGHMDH